MVVPEQMKKVNEITSYLFDDSLIISLSKDWVNVFGSLPKFSTKIKNGRLILTSQIIKGDEG